MRGRTWVLNMKDRHNCSVLESFKPGEAREVRIIIHEEPKAGAVRVKAQRSSDGLDFNAALPDGTTIEMPYVDLLRRIEEEKPEA